MGSNESHVTYVEGFEHKLIRGTCNVSSHGHELVHKFGDKKFKVDDKRKTDDKYKERTNGVVEGPTTRGNYQIQFTNYDELYVIGDG